MRTPKFLPLFALATVLAIFVTACGGDGDGGDGALELPPAGEYQFAVEATLEIELSEELVSAAPLALQQSQTVDLSGTATIDFGPSGATFNIPQFGISGTITIQGEDSQIQITENPDVPSTGEFTQDDTFFDLFLEVELTNTDTIVVRNEDPLHLEVGEPLVLGAPPLTIPTLTLMTPDDLGPFPFTDPHRTTTGL
ncbi:MAG: hypothetical protein IIA91_07205 [Chloroflexi bacterium]|nr:hypothetical protein [Chloroflexota bacterium]